MAEGLIRRGDFVLAVAPGEYGKARPALVIQSDLFDALPSVTLCPLTSLIREDAGLLRITVQPLQDNGLRKISQIAVDKITTLPVSRLGGVIGRVDDELMLRVTRALALFLGIS